MIENIKKEFPGKERDEALVRAEDLIAELAQGTRSDDFRIATLILDLDEVTPNLNNNIYEIMTSPQIASYTGTATEFVLGRMKAG